MVTSLWPQWPWFSALQEMVVAPPQTLPTSLDLLQQGPCVTPSPGVATSDGLEVEQQ